MARVSDDLPDDEQPDEPAPWESPPPASEPPADYHEDEDVDGPASPAAVEAAELARHIALERMRRVARRIVSDEEQLELANFEAIDVVTAAELVSRQRPERPQVLGDLVLAGHNAILVGGYKAGKSTTVENMASAMTSGTRFLARFDVVEPLRVVLLNYELDEEDQAERIAALALEQTAIERLLVVNLRGRRLPLMTDLGRDWLAKVLVDHGADVLIVDPFGAAYASAGGLKENDNGEVRRFLLALDEVKAASGCRTLVMPVHTGRGEQLEGGEHGRGATVIDDWPDVRMILTRGDGGQRFLRTEGRRQSQNLSESRLCFDPATRGLWLGDGDLGVGRRQARADTNADLVVAHVEATPGQKSGDLNGMLAAAGVTNNPDKSAAIQRAMATGRAHRHPGPGNAQLHYPGPIHPDDDPCPGGWTQ